MSERTSMAVLPRAIRDRSRKARRIGLRLVFLGLLVPGVCSLRAQETRPLAPPPDPSAPAKLPDPPIKELDGQRVQIGKVIIDRQQRTLTLSAEVNMQSQLVEYFLVTATGKVHESVLRTDAEPHHVHLAMLLLGAKGAPTAAPADFYDPKKEVPGDRITIELAWKNPQGTALTKRAEELMNNLQTKTAVSAGPWAYNGSQMVDGAFVAQREGSIVALISDPYALINNPRVGRENDEIWSVNESLVPPVKTAVEVTLRLGEKEASSLPTATSIAAPSPQVPHTP